MFFKSISSSKVFLFIFFLLTLSIGFSACGQRAPTSNSSPPDGNPAGQLASIPTTVLSIVGGDVFLMKPGTDQWVKAEEGINLEVDYKLKTETMSEATVSFFDGSTIELKGETEITLGELGFDESSSAISIRIKQEIGQTISHVKKMADLESRYEIETPAAVAAVRGTTVLVQVAPDGTTFVGNLEGLVSVIAQGVEVKIPQGSHVVILPGQAAGPVEPGASPSPIVAPSASPTQNKVPLPEPSLVSAPAPQTAKIAFEMTADRQTAYPGDTIIYSYKLTNTGSGALADISIADEKIGKAVFTDGDSNANQYLDADETWTFSGNYLVKAGESGFVTNLATVSATGPDKNKITAVAQASVKIVDIVITITSLQEGNLVTRTISVGGTVNDLSITQANINVNGQSRSMDVLDGNFNVSVDLADGTNTITISVTKPGGVVVSSSVTLVPQP